MNRTEAEFTVTATILRQEGDIHAAEHSTANYLLMIKSAKDRISICHWNQDLKWLIERGGEQDIEFGFICQRIFRFFYINND